MASFLASLLLVAMHWFPVEAGPALDPLRLIATSVWGAPWRSPAGPGAEWDGSTCGARWQASTASRVGTESLGLRERELGFGGVK